MELDLTSYNPTPNLNFPSDFEIELIPLNSDEKMLEMHTIAATNFLEPQEQDYRPTLISMRRSALEEPYYQYYVGKYQGKAVATISISLKHAFAGISQISDVTTLEAHRGKGYASVLIQFALAECKKLGFKWAVLQGERDGPMKLYKRLGFVTSCEIDVWEKPSDEGETSEAQSN
jgi:GNAT superfamily N-acetyltransferase